MERAVADRALGEYAELLARLGREKTLVALFAETDARPVGGSAAEKVSNAKDGLALMRAKPEEAFRCGPLALDRVLASLRANYILPKAVEDFPSTSDGTSLSQMAKLANDVGQPMQMAKRSPGSVVTLPAIVHWKAGHFAALVREQHGRYLVEDTTFGDRSWITREAMEEEAYRIRASWLTAPYRRVGVGVGDAEGAGVWGKGATTANNPQNYKPCDPKMKCDKCTCGSMGMSGYDIHLMLVSLNITDEPIGYSPALGPPVRFTATYNQREIFQPLAFSVHEPRAEVDVRLAVVHRQTKYRILADTVNLYVRGGGQETYVYSSTHPELRPAQGEPRRRDQDVTGSLRAPSPRRFGRGLCEARWSAVASQEGLHDGGARPPGKCHHPRLRSDSVAAVRDPRRKSAR